MTIRQFLNQAKTTLKSAGIFSAQLDSELILAHVIGTSREFLLAHDDDEISPANNQRADGLIKKRTQCHPLVHLTGHREFYGLEFIITPDVLTPRVETERMVELALEYAPQRGRMLDVGTGSGAIAVAIATYRPDLTLVKRHLRLAKPMPRNTGLPLALPNPIS